ncbi:MAG: GAF domain-containing protein [Pseudomonadota bacterium]
MYHDEHDGGVPTADQPKDTPEAPEGMQEIAAAKLGLLYRSARALSSTTDLDHLLSVIVGEVRKALGCAGAAVVIYDEERDDFYWKTARDPEGRLSAAADNIRIPKDQGVAGWVFRTGKPALIHDAAGDPRVYRHVETTSGFKSYNMICVPLQTMEKRLGALYALNKSLGAFTEEDVEVLMALSGNVALALENAAQYEKLAKSYAELDRLNRVKNKILNHLSHELKTPLAIIEASLRIMARRLEDGGPDMSRLPFERIQRNLDRLKFLEKQVGHIVENKDFAEGKIISGFLDHLAELIEIEEDENPLLTEALSALRQKIVELFPSRPAEKDGIQISAAFQAVEFRARQMTRTRVLNLLFVPPDPALIMVQPHIMLAVLRGLVRNAIENTPDNGKIMVTGNRNEEGYRVVIQDYGVGIPESERQNIFEGFCPVQETDLYSSGQRYAFNAGGTGTDLLKIRVFSERFGFKVGFATTRCTCIPTTRDICPGDISRCGCCNTPEDCFANGGTVFTVDFPADRVRFETAM